MIKYALCSNPLILYGRRGGGNKQQLPERHPEGITSKINISQQLTWRNVTPKLHLDCSVANISLEIEV